VHSDIVLGVLEMDFRLGKRSSLQLGLARIRERLAPGGKQRAKLLQGGLGGGMICVLVTEGAVRGYRSFVRWCGTDMPLRGSQAAPRITVSSVVLGKFGGPAQSSRRLVGQNDSQSFP
jgi:hypothetical protein